MLLAAAASYVAPGESSIGVGKTSLSDTPRYLRLINERAIANDSSSLWNTFKTNPDYTWVLEHVSIPLARRYAAAIAHQRCDEWLFAPPFPAHYRRNNLVGGPRTLPFEDVGNVSTTIVRYLKVVCDLTTLFGSLNGFSVAEIGVGYGGLPQVMISTYERLGSYMLIDLPPVERLASKYLHHTLPVEHEPPPIRRFHADATPPPLPASGLDLLISNYAFSEQTEAVQLDYLERVVRHAKRGYLTINPWTGLCKPPLTRLTALLTSYGFDVVVAREVPVSFEGVVRGHGRQEGSFVLWSRAPEDAPRLARFRDAYANCSRCFESAQQQQRSRTLTPGPHSAKPASWHQQKPRRHPVHDGI